MKTLILFLLLLCSAAIRPQTFHSLDGIETENGKTSLLYRLGNGFYYYNPVYKLNTANLSEELIMHAYHNNFPAGELAKAVCDFEFFPNDEMNFMNVGYSIYPDNHSYIARNDSMVVGRIEGYFRVDISKQDPLKVFVFTGGPLTRSFDGGYTFPEDSLGLITDFDAISLADFDDKVLFGINSENQLLKNAVLSDTIKIFFDEYTKFLYDNNQFNIYRVNKTYGGYAFSVSNNKGNLNSWEKTYQSKNPLFITFDPSSSGTVYLADGRKIYMSTNNGYTFTNHKNLISKIVGIYKKPGINILYAATEYAIYEITPDSITVVKSLPLSPDVFEWFPLKAGNQWVYSSYWRYYNPSGPPSYEFAGTKYMNVVADTIIEGKRYFILENNLLNHFVFDQRMFLRIDSTTGKIFKYWDKLNNEFLFHDLNAELGDTIYYPPTPEQSNYILWDQQENMFLNEMRTIRTYFENAPCGCYHQLVKGLGLGYTSFDEFGGSEDNLKGAVLNGVLYGDTTFVVSVENEEATVPTEFALDQNYPNPFNPSTAISYNLLVNSFVTLNVYDVLGNEVAALVNEQKPVGNYEVNFNALQLSSGIYFYQLKAGSYIQTRKMILMK